MALKLFITVLALTFVVVAGQFCVAFIRTPGIVAKAEQNGLPLQLDAVGEQRLQWLLKVEDPGFYHHHGIDTKTPGAGYTTMTQGLVKVLFYEYSFSPGILKWRKIQQSIIALAFDARVSKEEQIRLFVNLGYMGDKNGQRIIGFSNASHEYFGKNFQDITEEEYLRLVALFVSPERYSPSTHLAENSERVERIRLMLAGACRPLGYADVEYVGCAH